MNREQLERYNRNIIIESVGTGGQEALLQAKILVAGCGGLGSMVISSLASVGIGTLGLVDNDRAELSNLNRQFIHKYENISKYKVDSAREWISAYNPDITVNAYRVRFNEANSTDIIKDYDIVIDCFDSFQSKFTLNKICIENNKTLIHGGVTEFFGQVTVVTPQETACLSCLFPEGCPKTEDLKGVISPVVGIIGSAQAVEAVKTVLDIGQPLKNILLSFNALQQDFKKINIQRNPACPVCG